MRAVINRFKDLGFCDNNSKRLLNALDCLHTELSKFDQQQLNLVKHLTLDELFVEFAKHEGGLRVIDLRK